MSNKKVRVAIIGVGNCASSLIQGVEYYKNTPDEATVPGLMHVNLGGYHIRDIEFTVGIDVNITKVGKDLSEAIFAEPNNTYKFCEVPHLNAPVVRGMTHDGLGKYLSQVITKAPGPTADFHVKQRRACGNRCPNGDHQPAQAVGPLRSGVHRRCLPAAANGIRRGW